MSSTITSYNPDRFGRSSGRSGSDVERILAFHDIGRVDPIEYVDTWESVLANALKLKERNSNEHGR
jgi:7-cyano-7-deazaguanine synthase